MSIDLSYLKELKLTATVSDYDCCVDVVAEGVLIPTEEETKVWAFRINRVDIPALVALLSKYSKVTKG